MPPFARLRSPLRVGVTDLVQDCFTEPNAITADCDAARASDHSSTAWPVLMRLIAKRTQHGSAWPN